MDKAYYCTTCKKDVDGEICETCFSPTQPKAEREGGGSTPSPKASSRPAPSTSPSVSRGAASASGARSTNQASASPASASLDAAQVQEFLKQGYEVYLVAGINEAGKTELLAAYRQNAFLDEWVREQGGVVPTPVEKLNCYTFQVGRRKVMFMDASGERFWQLYPGLLPTELGESNLEFLRLISGHLHGVVLLLDLGRLWGPEKTSNPANARQVEILTWVLGLLRWLHFDGAYEPGAVSLQKHVSSRLKILRRRLKIPVQVLFSKADRLTGLLVPQKNSWLQRGGSAVHRTLYPVGEDPLLLAHHCLPELLDAVSTHAKHFRFDFVHSLVFDEDTGEVIDPDACGVTLSLQWLLDSVWHQALVPKISSRFWIGLQRFLDGAVKRSSRWQRLSDPVEVRG